MKNRLKFSSTLLVFTAVLMAPAMAKNVSPDEVIGQTWNYRQNGQVGQITYGRKSVTVRTGGKVFKGKLRVKGDEICTQYKGLRKGEEKCFTLKKTKNGFKSSHGGVIWK